MSRTRPPRGPGGFTLVELLLVLLIVGILAGLSMGGVQKQIEIQHAEVAKTRMAVVWHAEKRYYAFKMRYLRVAEPPDWEQLATPDPGLEDKYYSYRVDYDGTDFTVRATRRSSKGNPALAELTMNKKGEIKPR